MEYFSFAYLIEYLLIILFVIGVYYMASVNKKLKMLKSGGDGFKAVVIELNHATENAKEAIQGLKLTVRDAEHGLDGNLKQARSVTEELKYLLAQAGGSADGLQLANPRNVPLPSENLRYVQPPAVPQNRAKNFADQTLEKVAKQKQSLPNPIIHNSGSRAPVAQEPRFAAEPEVNLGLNIPAEHREMALQRRDQALKSIAAKNGQQNRQAQPTPQMQPQPLQQRPVQQQPMDRGANLRPQGTAPQRRVAPAPAPRRQGQAVRNPQNVGAQPVQRPQMSLSDMVGRHAEMERKSFTGEAESSAATPESKGGNERRQSLFQKLSRTR